jgi:hypothetical protein
MNLQDFISQALSQIIEGVAAAQEAADKRGATVNPQLTGTTDSLASQGLLWSGDATAQVVQFDVALTTTEGTGTKGGIGVFVGAVTLGSSGQSKSESSSVSRVKFAVPITLPPPA